MSAIFAMHVGFAVPPLRAALRGRLQLLGVLLHRGLLFVCPSRGWCVAQCCALAGGLGVRHRWVHPCASCWRCPDGRGAIVAVASPKLLDCGHRPRMQRLATNAIMSGWRPNDDRQGASERHAGPAPAAILRTARKRHDAAQLSEGRRAHAGRRRDADARDGGSEDGSGAAVDPGISPGRRRWHGSSSRHWPAPPGTRRGCTTLPLSRRRRSSSRTVGASVSAPETLEGADLAAAWERLEREAPEYPKYRTKTDREVAIVRLRSH